MLQQAHMANRASKVPNSRLRMRFSGKSWEMIRQGADSKIGFRAQGSTQGHKDVANWTWPRCGSTYLFDRGQIPMFHELLRSPYLAETHMSLRLTKTSTL